MRYIAAVRFADLEDGRRIYEPGEPFPRPGLTVTDERLKTLAGSDNLSGQPLIKAVETEEPKAEEKPKPRKRAVRK